MSRPLFNVGWRYLLRHPWQTALMILGIALGVAMVVAIDLANSAASRAFDLSTDAVAGRATHQIVAGPAGLDETVYTRLRVDGGIENAAPIVTDYMRSPQLGNRPIRLLGVDPFAEAPFRSYLISGEAGSQDRQPASGVPVGGLAAFLTRPGALFVSDALASEYGLRVGDRITVTVAGRTGPASIAGLLHPGDRLTQRALDGMVLADIATAQELTGRQGRLDYIDLILPADEALRSRIAGLLPGDAHIVTTRARAGAVAQMTTAFRTNLTALSLLALVVGMFLIYNSMTFSVLQRRSLFGTLRCLGVTRSEVGWLVISEAALVGIAGALLGVGLGVLLGQGAVRLVTQTINDLYFVVTVRGVAVEPASLTRGAVLGLLATMASAALPAWEAAMVPPRLALTRSGLEDKARRAVPLTVLGGIAALVFGGSLLAIPTRNLPVSFAGVFFVTIGFALLAPAVTLISLRGARPFLSHGFGVLGRMAPRSVTSALSRTAVAIAALMVAVSVTIGVGLMVSSFRSTVVTWLGQTLWGDVYISVPSLTSTRSSVPLEPQIVQTARSWPGVVRADVLRSVTASSPQGEIAISAVSDREFPIHRLFVSADGGLPGVTAAVMTGAVLASEPLANRLGLPAHGAHITLFTDHGPHEFPIAGVYRDYSSSQGTIMMALDLYRSYWDDYDLSAIALQLAPGVDTDALVQALSDRLSSIQGVEVQPNRALRAEALNVFDRAFAITGALQLLAAVVAFIGVLSALLSLQLERGREFGVLRAVGLTVQQVYGLVLLETGLMGAVAGFLAMPTGLALALILVYIINRRSFGWTLQFQIGPGVFLQALALAVAAALLAGVYPALRAGRILAAEALRSE
jgi:putative ABC transport system permease protein